MVMDRLEELIERIRLLQTNRDLERAHMEADDLLLAYIDNDELTALFNNSGFWYA